MIVGVGGLRSGEGKQKKEGWGVVERRWKRRKVEVEGRSRLREEDGRRRRKASPGKREQDIEGKMEKSKGTEIFVPCCFDRNLRRRRNQGDRPANACARSARVTR